MRLLNAITFEFQEFRQRSSRPPYAILSHRWFKSEITFTTLRPSELQGKDVRNPQIDKIRNTCRVAREDKLEWVWIDSCCINKDSSEEVNRSINAMFKWYQEAAVCYTFLSDVLSSERHKTTAFKRENSEKDSEWFERGWTLQELLAPRVMKIFDANWLPMGTKAQLAPEIERVTGIEARFLDGSEEFRTASIATRLNWQARRRTTEEEDMAYGLLGVLGVFLVPLYGEGRQSFLRLQQELLKTYRDESIFAWIAPASGLPKHDRQWDQGQWGLLAPWVDCFEGSRDVVITSTTLGRPAGGIAPIAEGVKFPIPTRELVRKPIWTTLAMVALPPLLGVCIWAPVLIHRHKHRQEWTLTLNCKKKDRAGELRMVQVFLCRDSQGDEFWRRCRCGELGFRNGVTNEWVKETRDITIVQPTGVWWPVPA